MTLPCESGGATLRNDTRGIAQLNNVAMDRRAVQKVDLAAKDKPWDAEFLLRVLVDPRLCNLSCGRAGPSMTLFK